MRCPGGGTGVRTRLLDARLMSARRTSGDGGFLTKSALKAPLITSRRSRPPAQAVSYQIYIHGCHSFPSCLAHRARAARECHPHHLSACATAAAVLCGFPQIWRVSLCVLRWAPKTAELQIRILMGFPRPWIDEMRGFGCADTMSSSGDRGLP